MKKKLMAMFLATIMVLSVLPLTLAENETEDSGVTIISPDEQEDDNEIEVEEDEETEIEEEEVEIECETTEDCDEDEICVEGMCERIEEDRDGDEEEETEVEDEEETEEFVEIDEEVEEEAGITPDSPLHGLERAMERISLALTFGKSAKAKKGLAHAHERLAEVQAMIAQKKLDKAAEAQEDYEEIVAEVEENVEELGNGDGEEQLADAVEIEEAMAKNEKALEAVNQIKLKVSKKLGAEESTKIQEMLQSMEGINSAFKVKVEQNKNKAKIKIKAEKDATDEEIAALENALKEGKELAQVRIVKKGKGIVKEKGKPETEDEAEETEKEKEETSKGKPEGAGKPDKDSEEESEEVDEESDSEE